MTNASASFLACASSRPVRVTSYTGRVSPACAVAFVLVISLTPCNPAPHRGSIARVWGCNARVASLVVNTICADSWQRPGGGGVSPLYPLVFHEERTLQAGSLESDAVQAPWVQTHMCGAIG